jgi:shikimate kinase
MIALIGFMGSGKSTLARNLAEVLGVAVYETDQLVYEITDCKNMNEVFEKGGENLLRRTERQILEQLHDSDAVIDCGGGLVTSQPSRKLLKQLCSQIIFLDAPFSLIKSRVGDGGDRPMYRDDNYAKRLYDERKRLYESVATDVIDVSGQTVEDLTAIILEVIR